MKPMKKHLLCAVGLLLAVAPLAAQPSSSRYSALDGKSGESLFNAVSSVAGSGYKSLGYDGLYTAYKQTDLKDGKIWDMYSNCDFVYNTKNTKKCGNYSVECDCYNREHSIPQSWWGGGTGNQGCDIFHVLPTDGKVNGMRSNYPYGEVSSATYTSANGSKLGSSSIRGYSGTVFEPIDEYKGDIARGILGAMTKWKGSWTQGNGSSFFNGSYTSSSNFGLTSYAVTLLLKWHREDPVSQKERDRNNGIEATQGNRNPFIDYPCLVEYIWGSHKGETFNLSQVLSAYDSSFDTTDPSGCSCISEPRLTQPANGSSYEVGTTRPDSTLTKSFTVKGANLSSSLTLTLSGTNSSLFAVSPTTITAAQAMAGQNIAIIYHPTAEGSHTAQLTISSSEFTSVTVTVSATCSSAAVEPDEPDTPTGNGDYVKVMKAQDDYAGTYLIVYDDANVCFNAAGSVSSTGNTLNVTISDNTIAASTEVNAAAVTIVNEIRGYTIQLPSGDYIGSGGKGTLNVLDTAQLQTISVLNGTATIKASNNTELRYNKSAKCFRYYNGSQQAVSLYRKSTSTATTNASVAETFHCTVTEGHLQVIAESPAYMALYDVMGRLVMEKNNATEYEMNLPQGFYLLRVDNHTARVLIP